MRRIPFVLVRLNSASRRSISAALRSNSSCWRWFYERWKKKKKSFQETFFVRSHNKTIEHFPIHLQFSCWYLWSSLRSICLSRLIICRNLWLLLLSNIAITKFVWFRMFIFERMIVVEYYYGLINCIWSDWRCGRNGILLQNKNHNNLRVVFFSYIRQWHILRRDYQYLVHRKGSRRIYPLFYLRARLV